MPLKILVCDDERHIVRLIQVNLERQGYQVVTAFDGKEGLEKIRAEKPNLVVLDVMMPYMDGFEVLKTLRREQETESLPVIMLTAKAQDKDVFEGYHYGADMYLTKPFNPMELVSFVKRIADSQAAGGDAGGPKRYDISKI
jgi:two-component system alkaline phosphatase synthesis response regulator PhoP